MSGHSKWSTIKRKKGEKDGARAKVFTKISREILVCIKETGSADPANNSRLYALVQKAKSNNIPNDNIDRLLKKAAGGAEKNDYEDCVYEGYGPNDCKTIHLLKLCSIRISLWSLWTNATPLRNGVIRFVMLICTLAILSAS